MGINAQLFNQLASIYGQMGRGIPGDGAPHLRGSKRTRHLRMMLGPAQQELNNWRRQQLQNQMRQAASGGTGAEDPATVRPAEMGKDPE